VAPVHVEGIPVEIVRVQVVTGLNFQKKNSGQAEEGNHFASGRKETKELGGGGIKALSHLENGQVGRKITGCKEGQVREKR